MTPDQAQTVLNDAEASLEAGDAARARILFASIADAEGPDPQQKAQAEGGLGEACLLEARPAEAAGHFERAAALDEGARAWMHYRLGEACMRTGEWERAADAFRTSHQAHPESDRRARAETLGRLGRARVLGGDAGGLEDLRQAIALDPLHAELHADLAECLLGRKAWREAEAAYARALELDPDCPDHRAGLARARAIAAKLA